MSSIESKLTAVFTDAVDYRYDPSRECVDCDNDVTGVCEDHAHDYKRAVDYLQTERIVIDVFNLTEALVEAKEADGDVLGLIDMLAGRLAELSDE